MTTKANRVILDQEELEYNVEFYTLLKNYIRIKFSDNQQKLFKQKIQDIGEADFISEFHSLISENKMELTGKKLDQITEYNNVFQNIVDSRKVTDDIAYKLMSLVVNLFIIKEFITTEAKAISMIVIDDEDIDLLSAKYDSINLTSPYTQRVAGVLLAFDILDEAKMFVLSEINKKFIEKVRTDSANIMSSLKIHVSKMYSILINESINQSITTGGGQSYEDRIVNTLKNKLSIKDFTRGTHDSKEPSVEYDFRFKYKKYEFGISAKRTLRERYKQNFDSVDNLDVDVLFLFTLGSDLNEIKMYTIISKKGNHILVAEEFKNSVDFLSKNDKVIGSESFTIAKLDSLIDELEKSKKNNTKKNDE